MSTSHTSIYLTADRENLDILYVLNFSRGRVCIGYTWLWWECGLCGYTRRLCLQVQARLVRHQCSSTGRTWKELQERWTHSTVFNKWIAEIPNLLNSTPCVTCAWLSFAKKFVCYAHVLGAFFSFDFCLFRKIPTLAQYGSVSADKLH